MHVRTPNPVGPDQNASSRQSDLDMHCLSNPYWQFGMQIVFKIHDIEG